MYNRGYPTTSFTWNDQSGASSSVLYSANTDGLNVPFFFVLSERGTPGAIEFGGAAELTPILGSSTFDPSSPYFNPSTQFLATAMAGQGVEVMRLVDPAATSANLGLFLDVTPGPITQYTLDSNGARILDGSGNPVPLMNGGTAVTEPGVVLKWHVRVLTSQESISTLVSSTSNGTTTYPILGFQVSSVGLYGNRQGFSLYSTTTTDSAITESINSILYRFAPLELPTSISTTASPINDIYGSNFNDVSFKAAAVYNATATNYALNYVLGTLYSNPTTGQSLLPYNIFSYGANVGTIGTHALAVSAELGAIDPYMIDLISCEDLNGNPYHHIELDPASTTVVNSSVVNYCIGGTDGDTSFASLQTQIQTWLSGSDHGEFTNLSQHPMTHFSDPGFSMVTKLLLFNMLDLRDNFKIDVSTQDVSLAVNTEAQDMSAGQTLAFRAQMHPESIIAGVGCCRVGVYAHAGTLINGGPYSGLIPFNLNRLIQRRDLDGGLYIKGSSGGRPNSEVSIFYKSNWVADDETVRALAWAQAMNVVMHANRTVIYYPSLRTVYPNDTSLLSDDEIVDRIVYMFKIAREVYSIYAGDRDAPVKLFSRIQKDIDNRCSAAFSADNLSVTSTVFQTAADANLGFSTSVNLNVKGAMPLRQMNFDVIVSRS